MRTLEEFKKTVQHIHAHSIDTDFDLTQLYVEVFLYGVLQGLRFAEREQKEKARGNGKGRFKKWLKSAFPSFYGWLFYN